jgi:hypothetical protein
VPATDKHDELADISDELADMSDDEGAEIYRTLDLMTIQLTATRLQQEVTAEALDRLATRLGALSTRLGDLEARLLRR